MSFDSILCPVDVLDPGERGVLEYASRLADALGAKAHALHVFDVPGYVDPDPEHAAVRSYAERALREHRQRFAELVADLPGRPVEATLTPGHPHRRIADEVERVSADLIVMGTHARRGFQRLLLGSVAERVVRSAAIPTLTVPRSSEPPQTPPRSILVPHDLSVPSRRALGVARALHVPLRAAVAVVHVLPIPLDAAAAAPAWLSDAERERYRASLSSSLDEDVADVFGPEAQAVRRGVETGEVVDQILARREELGADLIVVAASGKSGTERVLLGSVTIELLRRSPLPVLTVP